MNKIVYRKVFSIKLILVLYLLTLISLTGCIVIPLNNAKVERYSELKVTTMAKEYIKNKYGESLEIEDMKVHERGSPLGPVVDGYTIVAKGGYYIRFYLKNDLKADEADDEITFSDTKQCIEIEAAMAEYLKGNSISKEFFVNIISEPENIKYDYVSKWEIYSNGFIKKYSQDIQSFLINNPNREFNFYFKDNGTIGYEQFCEELKKIENELNIKAHAVMLNPIIYDKFIKELENDNKGLNIALHRSSVIYKYFKNYYFTKYTNTYVNNLINYSDNMQIGFLKENILTINPDDIKLNISKLSEKNHSLDNSSRYEILSDIYRLEYIKDKSASLNIIIDTKKLFPDIDGNEKIVLGDVRIDGGRYIISPRKSYSLDKFKSHNENDIFMDDGKLSAEINEGTYGFILMKEK